MEDRHGLRKQQYPVNVCVPLKRETKELWKRLKDQHGKNPCSIAREAIEAAFIAYIQSLEAQQEMKTP